MDHIENESSQSVPPIPNSTQSVAVQKPQRTWGVILVLFVVAALSAGGVFAYSRYINPPEKKINNALQQMAAANSFAYSGVITFFPSADAEYDEYLSMAASQASGKPIEKLEMKFSGAWEGKAKENNKWIFSVLAAAVPEQDLAVGFEMRSVNNILYGQLTKDTKASFDVSAYTNKWIKLDIGGYLQQFGLNKVTLASGTAGNKPTLDDIRNEKIKEMVHKANVFTINGVSTKKINGESFDVYAVTLQKENLRQLMLDIAAFENTRVTQRQKDRFEESLAELQAATGEVMVSKKDGTLRRVTGVITTTKQDKIEFEVSFTDFNKSITVSEPENAISVEELIGQLLGSLGQGFSTPSFNTGFNFGAMPKESPENDWDQDGLTDDIEKMYGTNPGKADTDGDGVKDLDEVMKGDNPNGPGKMPASF